MEVVTIQIWFHFDNFALSHQLPVLPPEIKVTCGSQNETVKIAGLGETTIIQDPAAKTFTWESWFPATKDPTWAHPHVHPPSVYVKNFTAWKDSGKPFRLIIIGDSWNVNVAATIEKFTYSERGGDVGTIHYSITCKEYKFITPRKLQQVQSTSVNAPQKAVMTVSSKPQRPNTREVPKEYRVKSGDTLSIIGRRFGIPWREIAAKNGIKAPYTIYANRTVLKLK